MSKEKKIAIHCSTEELWEKVLLKWSGGKENFWAVYGEESCINITPFGGNALGWTYADLKCYEGSHTIIPAEEWLREGEFKVKDRVVIIDSTDPYCGQEADVQGYFPKEQHPYQLSIGGNIIGSYLPQELKLKEPELEVGDEVEVIKSNCTFKAGHRGRIIGLWGGNANITGGRNFSSPISNDRLRLIKRKEQTMKEKQHTVPLRVGDGVRIVLNRKSWEKGSTRIGDIGVIVEASTSIGKGWYVEMNRDINSYCLACRVKPNNSHIGLFDKTELELIPTEADITVGSVWEVKERLKDKYNIITVRESYDCIVAVKEGSSSFGKVFILDRYKLIHRGDEEVVEHKMFSDIHIGAKEQKTQVEFYGQALEEMIKKQTNKKEKKMKRAEKVAKVGGLIRDENCGNHGRIEAIYIEQGKVTYTDIDDNSIHTVDVNRLSIPVVMPKVKAKKKTKKRGK